jgi:hypothetical protein
MVREASITGGPQLTEEMIAEQLQVAESRFKRSKKLQSVLGRMRETQDKETISHVDSKSQSSYQTTSVNLNDKADGLRDDHNSNRYQDSFVDTREDWVDEQHRDQFPSGREEGNMAHYSGRNGVPLSQRQASDVPVRYRQDEREREDIVREQIQDAVRNQIFGGKGAAMGFGSLLDHSSSDEISKVSDSAMLNLITSTEQQSQSHWKSRHSLGPRKIRHSLSPRRGRQASGRVVAAHERAYSSQSPRRSARHTNVEKEEKTSRYRPENEWSESESNEEDQNSTEASENEGMGRITRERRNRGAHRSREPPKSPKKKAKHPSKSHDRLVARSVSTETDEYESTLEASTEESSSDDYESVASSTSGTSGYSSASSRRDKNLSKRREARGKKQNGRGAKPAAEQQKGKTLWLPDHTWQATNKSDTCFTSCSRSSALDQLPSCRSSDGVCFKNC